MSSPAHTIDLTTTLEPLAEKFSSRGETRLRHGILLVTVPPPIPTEHLLSLGARLFGCTEFIEEFGFPHHGGWLHHLFYEIPARDSNQRVAPKNAQGSMQDFRRLAHAAADWLPRLSHSGILPAFQPIGLVAADKRRLSNWISMLYYHAWKNSTLDVPPTIEFSAPRYDLRQISPNQSIDDDLTTDAVLDRLRRGTERLRGWVTDHFGAFDVHSMLTNCVQDQMMLSDWRNEKRFRKPIRPFPDFFSSKFEGCLFKASSGVIASICHQYRLERSGTEVSPLPLIDYQAEAIKWRGKTYGSIPISALEMLKAIVSAGGRKVTYADMKKERSPYPNLRHEDRLDRIKKKLPSDILKHIDSTTNGHSWNLT